MTVMSKDDPYATVLQMNAADKLTLWRQHKDMKVGTVNS